MNDQTAASFRMLPSVSDLMNSPTGQRAEREFGNTKLANVARFVIERIRIELANGVLLDQISHESLFAKAEQVLNDEIVRDIFQRQTPVINATGVIIHTNLGRAPLSDAAKTAVLSATGYATVEYDLETGKRGRRGGYAEQLLCELTGAESAIIVNNCAAAALLVLTVLAEQKDVIVSRGELVEIGGDFRVPDVLMSSGATLREVGTTNRTKVSDYKKAIGEKTGVILRVHPSNYRIIGFTSTPTNVELADLAHQHGMVFYEDAGSGALIDLSKYGLGDEPLISRSISDGADVVTFSGDKLLGGPQSGLIVGRSELLNKIRKHPMFRVLRADKIVYSALEATLRAYSLGTALQEIPVLKMLSVENADLEMRTTAFVEKLKDNLIKSHGWSISVIENTSVVGGGSAPGIQPVSSAIAISHNSISADEIAAKLRRFRTPVIGRINDGNLLINLKTVFECQENDLLDALVLLISHSSH